MNLAILNGEAAARALDSMAAWAWQASWQGAAMAAVVAALLWLAGKNVSPAWRFALWGLVLARMAMPAVVAVGWKSPSAGPLLQTKSSHTADPTSDQEAMLNARDLNGNLLLAAANPNQNTPPVHSTGIASTASHPQSIPSFFRGIWDAIRRSTPWIWISGVMLLLLRVGWSTARLALAVSRMKVITDQNVLDAMRECCREMGISRTPKVRELPCPAAPALVGWITPSVLLPQAIIAQMRSDELRLILLHELAHVKRRDLLANWIATLIAIIHWPNPAVWLVWWRMRVERELACDEKVLQIGRDAGGQIYARTIVKLIEALSGGNWRGRGSAPVPGGAVGILEGKAQIQRRLLMIARFDARSRRWPVVAAGLGLLVGAMALSGVTRAADKAGDLKAGLADEKPDAKNAAGVSNKHVFETDAGSLAPRSTPSTPAAVDEASAKTAAKLHKPLKVQFDGVGLSDVVDYFRDATGVDIMVEWPALEAAGITRDAPVNMRLREPTPADAVLTLIFRSMGNGLQYEIEKGVVVISPGERKTATVLRVYDVSNLISPASKTAGAANPFGGGGPALPTAGTTPPVAPPTAGGASTPPAAGAGLTGGEGGGMPSAGNPEMDQLVMLLTATVEPECWAINGGASSIGVFKTKLVIKAPENVQKEIFSLLEMLRDQNVTKAATGVTPHSTSPKAGGF